MLANEYLIDASCIRGLRSLDFGDSARDDNVGWARDGIGGEPGASHPSTGSGWRLRRAGWRAAVAWTAIGQPNGRTVGCL